MEKQVAEIISQIQLEAFWLFLKLFGAGIAFMLLKGFAEKVVAYLQFRWNKDLSVGVKVFIQGQEGEIKDFNLSCIYISTHDRIIIIRMRRWLYSKFALVKDNVGDRELKPDK